jgi:RND family efflux transporter MFP subunit
MLLNRCGLVAVLIIAGTVSAADDSSKAAPSASRPVIVTVEATYPGANAAVVADVVAAPIEMHMPASEITRLYSRSRVDGSYTLFVTFKRGVKPSDARALVRRGVDVATPVLPESIRANGVRVNLAAPGVALFVVLFSTDNSRDVLYLSNFAAVRLVDELARLPSVGGVTRVASHEFGLEIWLDPDRLSARGLTTREVVKALKDQNTPGPAGGRLEGIEQFADLVIKTDGMGQSVRLRDVASVELGARLSQGYAHIDGKDAVALAIYPRADGADSNPRDAVQTAMERLKRNFPPGMDYYVAADLTESNLYRRFRTGTTDFLLAELQLPASASEERTLATVRRCEQVMMQTAGVIHVLSLSKNPFSRVRGGTCALAILDGNTSANERERLLPRLRKSLANEIPEALFRFRYLPRASADPGGYPVDFCVRGPDAREVRDMAQMIADKLAREDKLTDVAVDPNDAATPAVSAQIDRTKAADLRLSVADIEDATQFLSGYAQAGTLSGFDSVWPVRVHFGAPGTDAAEMVKQLKIRNARGELVPLGAVVALRDATTPATIDRLDIQPAVEITASPAKGVTLGQARRACESAAKEVRAERRFSTEYQLVWMRELPVAQEGPAEDKQATPRAEPRSVQVVRPAVREVTDYEQFTGRVDAVQSVECRARVSGYLVKTTFREGDLVKKGDLLFEIDPRPYQAQLDQAKSHIQLQEAGLKLARATLTRNQTSAKNVPGSVGQAELDQSAAAVEEAEARLQAARANVELAMLNLEFTRVTSPIDGRAGRQLLTVGNLVAADTTLLTTIVGTDPMYVYFDLDERTLLHLRRLMRRAATVIEHMPVNVGLTDEAGYPRQGIVDFLDNRVDATTGTIRARAVLPNGDKMLMPGMFARVRLATSRPYAASLVPDSAIGSDQGLKYVFVVDERNQIVYRRVSTGALQDGFRIITEGLRQDDHVIQTVPPGLRPGEIVRPVENAPVHELKRESPEIRK